MTRRQIVVVHAGLSQPSATRLLAERLSTATQDALLERGQESEVTVVDLREHAQDLASTLLTGFATGGLRDALDALGVADAVIVVTPVFQASYSGLFKTFFDVLDDGLLRGTPVLLAATGGTPRHSLMLEHAMRPMFAYLKAVTVPTAVFAAAEDWGAAGAVERGLAGRIDVAAAELAELLSGGRPEASKRQAAAELADPVPFEQLLAQASGS
ncbi:FMN reductase [Nostocoides sp. HKS02]|uniref:FMN reductase n=1 Tax=Nostocoides sp. HKS02 TaxID=1813880 RepID=UPI0012B440F6|nr:FMN reductase [Tetrasphaera sp. HKS02]QGN57386.1 NADPH-dependent FMN reductase [Tetrasphaera sp. HKS02]